MLRLGKRTKGVSIIYISFSLIHTHNNAQRIELLYYKANLTVIKYTTLNPQNLRNIVKELQKISIIQILMSNLSVKKIVFCYFLQLFRYPTNFARLR